MPQAPDTRDATARAATPAPLRALEVGRLAGSWHVVATTLPFWRTRRDPIIRY